MRSFFSFLIVALHLVDSSKVLILNVVPSPSHTLWFNVLAKLLLENGHQVTMLSTLPLKSAHENLTHFVIENAYAMDEAIQDLDLLAGMQSLKYCTDLAHGFSVFVSENSLKSKALENLMEASKGDRPYDLIIKDMTFGEALIGLVHKFGNPPLILATAYGSMRSLQLTSGNYYNPVYFTATPFYQPSNLMEKLSNIFLVIYETWVDKVVVRRDQEQMYRAYFGDNVPSIQELENTASLFFFNSHVITEGVLPTVPAAIHLGGLHIPSKRTPLEKDLEDFLDGAKEGVIYFSFGSNIKSSDMSVEKVKAFISAFEQLPQRVLWKWNGNPIPNLPDRIMTRHWFSQSDVLAHPNIKAFISHGGLLGTQEAVYHGVPLLIVPFFCDQITNAQKMVRQGLALTIQYKDLNAERLRGALEQLIANAEFRTRMKLLSQLMKDSPESVQERALYWMEYTLRHGNLTHLRAPTRDMSLTELFMLDVIGVFIFALSISVFVIRGLIKLTFCKILRRGKKSTTQVKRKMKKN